MWDVYSDTIRGIYNRYKQNGISESRDSEILLDYEIVNTAIMTYISDDARYMAKELREYLKDEILYRMGRYRRQAKVASEKLYATLLDFGDSYE